MTAPGSPAQPDLERTRSAVLNVLIAVGFGIAISGLALRWRDGEAVRRAPESSRRGFHAGLLGLVVASYLVRRIASSRAALRPLETRSARFYRGHVGAAAIGLLAIPLGLAHCWHDRPRLDSIGPYWVAALALGSLALPRASELEGLDNGLPGPNEPHP